MSQEKKDGGQEIAKMPKKVYATPTFIKYGSISKLTRGSFSLGTDIHSHAMTGGDMMRM